MKILGILQNQWFHNPERMKHILATQFKGNREKFTRTFLFFGCLTGRRLQNCLGEELCSEIIWEECSPEMGGFAASKFKPDLVHISLTINNLRPNIIIAFGSIAQSAFGCGGITLNQEVCTTHYLQAPHPAARQPDVIAKLCELRETITKIRQG